MQTKYETYEIKIIRPGGWSWKLFGIQRGECEEYKRNSIQVPDISRFNERYKSSESWSPRKICQNK